MKCPKCGSDLDTGFNCPKCGSGNWQTIYEVKPELSTAEKLLSLVENYDIYIHKYDERGVVVLVEDRTHSKFLPTCLNGTSFEKAINKAYEWAKEHYVKCPNTRTT